jgi:hypothetical protein
LASNTMLSAQLSLKILTYARPQSV